MATPEEAICTALGTNFDPDKVLDWSNDDTTNQVGWLQITYDGDPGLSQEAIVVEIIDGSTED